MMTNNLELVVLGIGLGYACSRAGFIWLKQDELISYGLLLVYILFACFAERMLTYKDGKTSRHFRTVHSGLPYCLVLQLTLSWKDEQFLICLVPITFLQYTCISLCQRTVITYMISCVMCLCAVYHMMRLNSYVLGIAILLCLVYVNILQYGPRVFQKSFSFGELSLMAQLYVNILYRITTVAVTTQEVSVIEKGGAVIFITLNFLMLVVVILKCLNVTKAAVLSSILFGTVYIKCVIHWCLPLPEIKSLIQQLLLSKISIILLSWWILCSVISVIIVCYYGNSATKVKDKIDTERTRHYTTNTHGNDKQQYSSNSGNDNRKLSENGKAEEKYTQLKNSKDRKSHKSFNSPRSNDLDLNGANSSDLDPSVTYTCRREVPVYVRKYFHVLILAVYIPGLMFHHQLLYVATCGVAALFVLIEAVRYLDIQPVSSILNQYLQIFLDKQDQGDLILTPIYLLVGCSLPLWIYRPNIDSAGELVYYSGLISVGVGDAAASVFGRKFGRHKWPDSKKTVEGTMAAFLSQIIFLVFLYYAGIWILVAALLTNKIPTCYQLPHGCGCVSNTLLYPGVPDAELSVQTVLVLILISSLEAFTQHIDNLVVPVFAIMLFTSLTH